MQLLTAFVDGELSQRQRKAVMRLLEKSSEARAMLKQLQENVYKLKKLPYHKAEPSLVEDVLRAIVEQQSLPRPVAPRRRAWLPYVAATLAASVLIVVVGLVYWKTVIETPNGPKNNGPEIVNNDKGNKVDPIPVTPRKKDHPLLGMAMAVTEGTHRDFSVYVPSPQPYLASFGDLTTAQSKASGEFAHKLNMEKSVYLEIKVSNNDAAMSRLRDVLKERQIKLVSDPAVNKILKSKTPSVAEFLVYADNLRPDDVTKLMRELSSSYVVGEGMKQKMVGSPYKQLALSPSDSEHLKVVAKLLGVPVDAVEITERKDNSKSKSERQAVVIPVNGAGAPSKEVSQFVSQRQAPQTGMLQVIIKIRQE